MNCSRCGAPLAPNAAVCGACGAPAGYGGVVVSPPARPALVTVLALLQFLGAGLWLLAAAVALAVAVTSDSGQAAAAGGGLLLGGIAAVHLMCGIGLWTLKPYGRTLQLVFAWIGLIGIPIGTLISILILVYLFKPGIKLLFSGRPAAEWTPDERTQIAIATQGSQVAMLLVILLIGFVSIGGLGVIAAVAVPGLLRARMSGNEASAIGALRAIHEAQISYAASCARGAYAVALEDLAKPPVGSGQGFISPELGTNGATRSGYSVAVARNAAAEVADVSASDTCNGSTGAPASSYFATAEPVTPGSTGNRYFAIDHYGVVYSSMSPIANPIVESADVVPVR